MKKKSVAFRLMLALAFCSSFFTHCKKNDNGNSKVKLLQSAAWKYQDAGLDLDKNGTVDSPLPVALQKCDTDNTLTFKTDTSGVVDEGASKCNVSYPQTSTFKYTYSTSANIITFSTAVFAGVGGDAKVLELSATTLRLSQAVTQTIGSTTATATVIVTLVH